MNKCFSVNNEDFNYEDLESLIECNEQLRAGDIVWIADAMKPKHSDFVNVYNIIENMAEEAWDVVGEAAEDYGDVSKEAELELEAIVTAWAGKYCHITFFEVKNVREYILQEGDFE